VPELERNVHITAMKKKCTAFLIALAALSCGREPEPEFTPAETELITTAAGMLARNLAYSPDSSNWSPPPDEEMIAELEALAEQHFKVWPIFFRATADTSSKLEQILIQSQQEEQQLQLL
jgi:hypothetical protein